MAKISALGEKQFFVLNFELPEVEQASTPLSLEEVVVLLGETLDQPSLDEATLPRVSAPLLRLLRESEVYQRALVDPALDGFLLTVFREPNYRKKRAYRANWLGGCPAEALATDPVNLTVKVMRQSRQWFNASDFHKRSKVHEIMGS